MITDARACWMNERSVKWESLNASWMSGGVLLKICGFCTCLSFSSHAAQPNTQRGYIKFLKLERAVCMVMSQDRSIHDTLVYSPGVLHIWSTKAVWMEPPPEDNIPSSTRPSVSYGKTPYANSGMSGGRIWETLMNDTGSITHFNVL